MYGHQINHDSHNTAYTEYVLQATWSSLEMEHLKCTWVIVERFSVFRKLHKQLKVKCREYGYEKATFPSEGLSGKIKTSTASAVIEKRKPLLEAWLKQVLAMAAKAYEEKGLVLPELEDVLQLKSRVGEFKLRMAKEFEKKQRQEAQLKAAKAVLERGVDSKCYEPMSSRWIANY